MGRPTKLTPELQAQIVKDIGDGAYDWIAAQAAGIAPSTFWRWMQLGEKGNHTYSEFCKEVKQARAKARVKAEAKVFKSNPFAWLRYGPGRDRPGEPGWTDSVELNGSEERPLHVFSHDAAVAAIARRSTGDHQASGAAESGDDGAKVG